MCRIRYSDGRWIHFHPDATLVDRKIHFATISEFNQRIRDYWCYGYTPKAGDVVVDVGAGSGHEAMLFSQMVGERGRVIAIEAHPFTYSCLRETVRLNGLKNVTTIWCAAADRSGMAQISDNQNDLQNTIVSGTGSVQVPMRALEEICTVEQISRISLLKMNIEGAEQFALPGLRSMASSTEHLAIACHDFLAEWGKGDEFRTREKVSHWLAQEGFAIATRTDQRAWVQHCLYAKPIAIPSRIRSA